MEFARLGIIGIDVFSDVCQEENTMATCGLLSFWSISWGIIGAFVHSFISLMERIPRKDVNPRYFLNVAMRYIFAIALSAVFYLITAQAYNVVEAIQNGNESLGVGTSSFDNTRFTMGMTAAISFFIGMFPNRYLRILETSLQGNFKRNQVKDIPLESFSGINVNEATRLWEEGIDNVDQLADCSVQDLYKNTKFNPMRLKGLIGRALLWKYLFGNDNMLVALGISKPIIGYDDAESRVKDIQSFPFFDVQGLCSFLFAKRFEDIDIIKDKPISENITMLLSRYKDRKEPYISEEGLRQLISLVPYFKNQLSFTATNEEIRKLIEEESED